MRTTVTLLFLLIYFHLHLYAQQSKIDSLTQVLAIQKDDTSRVKTLNQLSKFLFNTGKFDSALKYSKDALSLAEKIAFKKGIVNTNNRVGMIYEDLGDYAKALKYFFASQKASEEIGDKKGAINSYINIGNVYNRQANYNEALNNYSEALSIAEEIGSKMGISIIQGNIGNVHLNQKNYSEAIKKYSISLSIAKEIEYKQQIAFCYNNMALVYEQQNNYPEALKNHLASLSIENEIDDKPGIAISYVNLGNLYTRLFKYDMAGKYLTDGLLLSKEIGSKEVIKESYRSLSKLDSVTGNIKGAYQYLQLYMEMKDSLVNEESNKQISQLKIQYETEKKEKELGTLKIQNELQIQKTKQRNTYILLIASISLLVLSVLWLQSNARKKRLIISEKEIEKKNLELVNKDLSIEKKKAEERAKVQKEIAAQYHDIVGAKITSLLFMCENEKAENKHHETLNGFASRVSLKIKEIAETNRSGIIALDPDTEKLDSFIAKLRSDLYDLVDTAGKEIHFLIPSVIPDIKIEPIVKFNLSALMKEAINNSIKYSRTNDVTVQLEINGTGYIINVIDHGAGIDREKKNNHSYGLMNMQSRMESIGGTCTVISEVNAGTTVRLEGDLTFANQINQVHQSVPNVIVKPAAVL